MAFQDILSMLQRANVFAPQNTASQEENNNQAAIHPAIADSLYQPSNAAATAYLNAAQNIPDIRDYQPSRLRKIGAVIAGLGTGRPAGMFGGQPVGFEGNPGLAQKTTESALYAPYDIALQNAEERLKPLQAASELENQENSQERLAASLAVRTDQGQQRIDQAGERIRQNAERLKHINNFDDARAWAATNPTYVFKTDENGLLVAYDSKDPSVKYETGLKTGNLGDAQKAELGLKNAETLTKERLAQELDNALKLKGKDQENALDRLNKQLQADIIVKQTPGPDVTTSTHSKLNFFQNEKNTTSTKSSNAPEGTTLMIGPDGKTYAIKNENIQKALAQGYKLKGGQ